ncbi:enoyl-CoA hydratase/isomerase family protein [Cupriavidus sp. CuC1]|uniref:enoyl-CoA hydratase/isomerase family protein n=1 Tax=Cupriavidus sp. CuC1 TaxID=3373131 RepID=UPI0037D3A018
MIYSTLEVSRDGYLARIALNRPEVRNAFNEVVIAELTDAFNVLALQDDVRAILLAAKGQAFCAGADLNWMRKMAGYTRDENVADARQLAEMLHTIWSCPKPVVAVIQGDTYAGGMGLVAACDIAVAAGQVNFCLSETKLGLIPATIGPYVVRAMGEQAARRYCVTAERFSAGEAHRIGFIHEVVAAEALEGRAVEIATALAGNSPAAVRESKRLVQDIADRALDASLIALTAERIADIRASEEGREGVRSFLEKRKPAWIARSA